MATKKTEEIETIEPTVAAEDVRDKELELEELLADVPAMRAPERLRILHKNALKAIGLRHADDLDELRELQENNLPVTQELTLALMDMAAEIDSFCESIAFDKAAYEDWSVENSDNISVFVALLNKYVGALGE